RRDGATGLVEGEVQEGAIGPGGRGVAAADPPVVDAVFSAPVVAQVEVESEAVAVQRQRAVEGGDLEDHGDETRGTAHAPILLAGGRGGVTAGRYDPAATDVCPVDRAPESGEQ